MLYAPALLVLHALETNVYLWWVRCIIFIISLLLISVVQSQVLLNLNDSALWYNYAQTGVQQVEVYTQLVNNGKKETELLKFKAELNTNGQIVSYKQFKGKSLAISKEFTYHPAGMLQSETDKKGHNGIENIVEYAYNMLPVPSKRTRKIGDNIIATEYLFYNEDTTLKHQAYVTESDSSNTFFKYKYDEYDRLIEKTSLYPENDDYYTVYYEFQGAGKSYTKFDWSQKHGKKKVADYYFSPNNDSITIKRYSRSGDFVSAHTYIYDNNLCVQENIHDQRNATDFTITRTFNKKGKIKEEIGAYDGHTESDYHFKQVYNCKGQLKKLKHYNGEGKKIKCAKYTYDKKGNTLGHKLYKEGNLYLIVRYEYVYFSKSS